MTVRRLVPLSLAFALLALVPLRARAAAEDTEKTINKLVKLVRYEKDDEALKLLDGEGQGAILLGDDWAKGTPAQREEFVKLFHGLFAAMAFPNLRKNLEHLETMLCEPPKVAGDKAETVGTLVILHPLKKQELKVKYDLRKLKDGWRVTDVTVLGTASPSMLTGIRDDQVKPIFAQGGWDKLLGAMRDRLAQLQKK
jgi:phospholipid transport system substrate-binding protein